MATHILTFDKDITIINSGAFANQTKLTSISFPDGITLENNSFKDCINLESVNIPANVTIQGRPFNGCVKLVNAPEAVPSHDYVEIGGIKWATMNIGANTIYDVGLYFAWGDTQGYTAEQVGVDKKFGPASDRSDYIYGNQYIGFSKYNETDNKTILDLEDDAIYTAWGGNWRMPTMSECQTFSNAVNTAWITNYNNSGVDGWLCTDKNDNAKTLFFPESGAAANGTIVYDNHMTLMWSSTLGTAIEQVSGIDYGVNFGIIYNTGKLDTFNAARCFGRVCRGVLDE